MEITIKRAKPEDADALLQYLRQVGGETDNLTFGSEGMPISVAEEAELLAKWEHSGDNLMLVAWDNGKAVGNANLSRQPRRMSHRGSLAISVLREYWSRGLGSLLLEKIIAFARENGFTVIDLEVRSDNSRAIRLYEKFGFEKLGTHPAFFKMKDEDIPFDYMYLRL